MSCALFGLRRCPYLRLSAGRSSFRRRRKCAGEQNAFGMRRPETGVRTMIDLVEAGNDIAAQGQHLFIRRQWHGLTPFSGQIVRTASRADLGLELRKR